jgi:hypothetical protein
MSVLGGQWRNLGPDEARDRHENSESSSIPSFGNNPQAPQQKMNLGHEADWRPEPHQQTPEQFAADPRTWWHGRFANKLTAAGGAKEGFHAGTRGAAQVRVEQNFSRRGGDKGHTPHLFPLRLTGEMGNWASHKSGFGATPENPASDMEVHRGLGQSRHGYFYRNNVEDPGHISVGVPKRGGFLATHKEMVQGAIESGLHVHPNIAWAAKKAPEHTGEDAVAHKRFRPSSGSQQSARDILPMPKFSPGGMVASPEDKDIYRERIRWGGQEMTGNHRGDFRTDRQTFVTEGGKKIHAWRPRGGNANEPKSWERTD